MKFISVVSGCYNEEENVGELCSRIAEVFATQLPEYDYECILIDNASQDVTRAEVSPLGPAASASRSPPPPWLP